MSAEVYAKEGDASSSFFRLGGNSDACVCMCVCVYESLHTCVVCMRETDRKNLSASNLLL